MNKPVHRLGDLNEDDGEITEVIQNTVFANNLPISVDGSIVEDVDVTANGCLTVYIQGIPVNRQGDEDEDGSARAEGSPNVFVGDSNVGGAAAPGSAGANGAGAGADGGADNNGDATVTPATTAVAPPNISAETLAATSTAMSRAVVTAMLDAGNANQYPALPFGANNSGPVAAVAAADVMATSTSSYQLSEQGATDLQTNYLEKILNSQAMAEKYPPWPNLPFGGNNA